ncbi:hypothetical protein WME99_34565 [Sorangium sp. So ce136]|uniref:hypothetical protein n=1 Tax=Sorangium sp. So ce136 TaxID=3133284 RepID=UPI003EFEB918
MQALTRELYVDNDIIHKLSALGIADEALGVLHGSRKSARILVTAKYALHVVKTPEKGVRKYTESVHARICEFVMGASEVEEAVSVEDTDVLNAVLGIDVGEAVLISCASRSPDSLLLTGDKRSLQALSKDKACEPIFQRLAGRVLSLEHIVLELIRVQGFERVRQLVVPAMQCDTALRSAFGSGMQAQESSVVQALQAYISGMPANLMRKHV